MARIGYIPYNQDREDQKAEEKAERRAMKREPVEDTDTWLARFEGLDPNDAEFESVTEFAGFMMDSEQFVFDHRHLLCLNARTGTPVREIKDALMSIGFTMKERPKVQNIRGFSSNCHNLYQGNPMSGGGGGSSINGFAGQVG